MATDPITQELHAPAAGPASGLGPDHAQPSAGAWAIREQSGAAT